MEGMIVEFMLLFGVSRPMAILKMFELMCLGIAAPMILFSFIRLGFHAMHFSVLKEDVRDAKRDAERSADRAHSAALVCHAMMISSSLKQPDGDQDVQDGQ